MSSPCRGCLGPAGRFAASFGPPRYRRPACRSSSWQAGGTGTARHGSPSMGDDAGVGPPGLATPGWICRRSAVVTPRRLSVGLAGGVRFRGLPPARPGLRSRGEPCTYHRGYLTARWIKTACYLDDPRTKWIMRRTGSLPGAFAQRSSHLCGRFRCRCRCARCGCETAHTRTAGGRAPCSLGGET